MRNFGRVLTAMVTPFHADFSVNYAAAAKLAKYLVAHGNDGLVVAGSTGESATLSCEEKLKLFSTVLDAVGDNATVIAGTGSNDTLASIRFTKEAEKLGVHGAMLVGPYYNKPPQEGFYRHFQLIAEATDLETGSDDYILMNTIVAPDLSDKELQKAYGCVEPTDIVGKIFDAGEIVQMVRKIMELAGWRQDIQADLHEEVKN